MRITDIADSLFHRLYVFWNFYKSNVIIIQCCELFDSIRFGYKCSARVRFPQNRSWPGPEQNRKHSTSTTTQHKAPYITRQEKTREDKRRQDKPVLILKRGMVCSFPCPPTYQATMKINPSIVVDPSIDVMSCPVMSCHVMSCHVMSCHVMSCHASSEHDKNNY